ncbi:UNVERIFIED_CONTAM: hypothetical protein Slati_2781300 [Sesamum latifolium]|uniref:Uncharacterized protein n=1 Tax=Sesamum latifolium TaxID=2727402 RepID=A0AAW2VY62_9LAMI
MGSGGAKRAHAQATSTIIEIDYTVPARVPVIHFGPTDAQGMEVGDIPLEPVDTLLYSFTSKVVHP